MDIEIQEKIASAITGMLEQSDDREEIALVAAQRIMTELTVSDCLMLADRPYDADDTASLGWARTSLLEPVLHKLREALELLHEARTEDAKELFENAVEELAYRVERP